jgi:hypothetical protein
VVGDQLFDEPGFLLKVGDCLKDKHSCYFHPLKYRLVLAKVAQEMGVVPSRALPVQNWL